MSEEGYQPHSEEHTLDADQMAEFAGRACYQSWGRPNPTTASNKGYLYNILDKAHYSIFEHAYFTFYIVHASRSFTHELIRHRHMGFSELSQRYVDMGDSSIVEPEGLEPEDAIELAELHERSLRVYRNIQARAVAAGAKKKEANQRARAALLGSTETKIVVSGNVRAWREVIQKRTATDAEGNPLADPEFHAIASEIERLISTYARNSAQDLGKQLIV